jgi:tRNA(Ile)-lysidine synthase
MNIHHKIENFIVNNHLIKSGNVIIVGLSGGPDSVFLLYFLLSLQQKYNLSLIAAHFNHEWRAQADQEQHDCATLAKTLNIPFITAKRSELSFPFKHNGSQEEYGRKMRRYFFEQVLREHNADAIALAHHLQDQEETFFIRLIRGSSLTGLTAIKAKHGTYIRPLLETHKADMLAWLHANNIQYAIDHTNESVDYLRNRIRMKVLPALRECDDRFEANFLATLNRLKTTEHFLEKLTHKTFHEISSVQDNQRYVDVDQFIAVDEPLRTRVLMHWLIIENVQFATTQAFLDEIIRFIASHQGGTHAAHQQWSVVKKRKTMFLLKQ